MFRNAIKTPNKNILYSIYIKATLSLWEYNSLKLL